ncbi:MmgE/PrpD family protein [Halobaculum magnesiiphilum]|uniref:MmgE/PrpD family protein n=1 Tax=Halobaculum magnesiiphilum TaxID=1017351 RepID=A0A8T8WI87_9EURY|nr:MmgE/PrpD family protein [Halobaculum magnesiiphilum]QZP39571.1 MmgE/PrpD family protein [Halobaculum magnesiiphilum]
MTTEDAVAFAHTGSHLEVPETVTSHLRARVLDTLATVTAGYRLPTADIVRTYATHRFAGADDATLLDGTGTGVSLEAATLANATAANALDIDDGHREVKGHPAAVVVPAALAAAEAADATVGRFLDAVLVGYELAVRAGLAIHATDDVYTGTGSWGAVGAAAAVGRLRGNTSETLAHALGTAEYHAPRTPITRGVEQPGMTKDGIGWGAYAGTVAALLAERGFTGSGTVFDESSVDVTDSLGDQFHVTEGYLKPYPCCRWAHPGVAAAIDLRERAAIDPDTIERVQVETFVEATTLDTHVPDSAEAAEYSYPYPVAVALARGRFTPTDLDAAERSDPAVRSLADRIDIAVDESLDERFPTECLARVTVETTDGTYQSDVTRPPGARERPLTQGERIEKASRLLRPTVDETAVESIRETLRAPDRPVRALLAPWSEES